MKKIILIAVLLSSITVFGQNHKTREKLEITKVDFVTHIDTLYGQINGDKTVKAITISDFLAQLQASGIGAGGGTDDQTASEVTSNAYLTISATNVQAALEEIKDEIDALSVGGSSTNLTYQSSPTNGVVESSTGANATIPAADGTIAGLYLPGHYNKMLNITATQAVDLDQMEIDVAANNAKVTNTDNQTGEQVFLDNYVKAVSSQAISATDNVTDALEKLEYKVDNASGGGIQSVVAGTNVTVDNTDPLNPVVSSTGGGSSYTFNAPLSESGGAVSFDDTDFAKTNVAETFNNGLTVSSASYNPLKVRRTSANNAYINFEHAGNIGWNFGLAGSTADFGIGLHNELDLGNQAKFKILRNGNTGIGQTNQTEKLEVVGNIKASGSFIGDGSQLTGLPSGGSFDESANYSLTGNVSLSTVPSVGSSIVNRDFVAQFNSFNGSDFGIIPGGGSGGINQTISIDDTKWATDAEVSANYAGLTAFNVAASTISNHATMIDNLEEKTLYSTSTATTLDLSKLTKYNAVTPSTAQTYTVTNPTIDGLAECLINTSGMNDYPAITPPSGYTMKAVESVAFEQSYIYKMVVEFEGGTEIKYYFLKQYSAN